METIEKKVLSYAMLTQWDRRMGKVIYLDQSTSSLLPNGHDPWLFKNIQNDKDKLTNMTN